MKIAPFKRSYTLKRRFFTVCVLSSRLLAPLTDQMDSVLVEDTHQSQFPYSKVSRKTGKVESKLYGELSKIWFGVSLMRRCEHLKTSLAK